MVEYRNSVGSLTIEMLRGGFFDGWPASPDPAEHLRLLHQSDFVEMAIDDAVVVGFVTAISDRALSAYVPLLEVLPAYQGRGIGTELVRRLLERLADFYMVDLACDDDRVSFYERLGFTRLSAVGRRNYAAQVGGFGLPRATEFDIRAPTAGIEEMCADILEELPTWFGIPEANADYVAASVANETLFAYEDDHPVGLLTIVEHGPSSAEIHLMAVRPQHHRRGIGRALVEEAERRLRTRGVRFLQVKTLSARHPDKGYALTRGFYRDQGFVELEEFAELWGPESPAVQMIKAI
ncbi:MAG: GNAT family N-acetyltransferase [Acidimicrobiales bacterium]|nr:GNAT family N-acetyltransferase [Acidimicrobiales bacterium]